jgi:diguanylate cyclase
MERLKPIAVWLIGLPKGVAEAVITGLSVLVSVSITGTWVWWRGAPDWTMLEALMLAALTPLLIASVVAAVLMYLLRELDAARQTAHTLAHTDPLTGCANRRRWMEVAQRQWQRHQTGAVAMSVVLIDLDDFKRINDQFGHDAGDSVLCAAARAIEHALRPNDLLARWGGEEFVALLAGAAEPHAADAAERVRAAIASADPAAAQATPGPAEPAPSVTASIGVASSRSGESLDQLINRADSAMYEAKRTGKNRCVQAD